MSEKKRCPKPKCNVEMEEVTIVPELSVMKVGTINLKYGEKRPRIKLSVFKCPNCGFIEFYSGHPEH